MTIDLTVKQVKKLRRILSWVIHNRSLDPVTNDDARELYHAISHPTQEDEE